ncbi:MULTISPECIES: complex I NDUFA9 subunit family protein [unclassified Bradyrhizobium]|uniref:complex I NDUFA9 subunit family protein n=1 Tax=unclassified Bradyrhizobium TaxID=2631580 RepID=UPI00247973E3|nr:MULTISPECIES: complex I NDUFA9 subunit family protein [unclassified Bradyrhizobium]WGR70530.1 complex I NDUFA9 subunit family protein [Bradyrhizobium sp. ISRA426]WGR82586.1 complex I NDUFA9 subunit family protein [Bradyrhizobium sp. ISRA430]WGR85772.1 complex I NDUFA9 subunit family protein [Bradyrhizobium sp. ISRA432]
MAAASNRLVTVFGGTGFLGRRIVRCLLQAPEFSVRIASRNPERGGQLFGYDDPRLQSVQVDLHDEGSIAGAIDDVYGAINAVSLYVEHGPETFHSVHVESARRLAAQAHRAGVKRLIHVSGIGSDATSPSLYIRKRGEGELGVRAAFSEATLVRPAVMFGANDAFLTTILKLLRRYPIYPMFGRGSTRLQPAYVDDVAEAVTRALLRTETGVTYECAGPRIYTYEELLRSVAHAAGRRPILIPVPFAAWHVAGWVSELFARPPITRNQVELMQIDSVASIGMPGFSELGIPPQSVEQIISTMLRDSVERNGS